MGKKFKKETIASKAGIGTDIQHGAIVPPLILEQTLSSRILVKNRLMNIQDKEIQPEIN